MLRIHDDMLDAVRLMRGALAAIERRDADLARQLRRAASSVVLNIAEGSGSFGRVRESCRQPIDPSPFLAGRIS